MAQNLTNLKSVSLRWVLANVIGWSVGLYFGAGLAGLGLPGLLLGGAAAGLCAGVAQWYALRHWLPRRWVLLSMVGGVVASLPALLGMLLLFAGPRPAFFVAGALFGGLFGAAQWWGLRAGGGWWLATNIVAGGMCGCLVFTVPLPVFLSPGPILFGLLTGLALRHVVPDEA